MMKTRTIEELHDKHYGHRKFAKVCDLLIADGHEISNIKEYYVKFTFELDGYFMTYDKEWKISAKKITKYILDTLAISKVLRNYQNQKGEN